MSALLAAAALALPLSLPPNAAPPTPVGLGLREWRIGVYRASVRAGRVKLNLTNYGEDAHNVQVFGPRGYRSAISADAAPLGGRTTFVVSLQRAGVYRLVCVKPGHAELGMRATLRVTPKPRRR